MRFKKVVIIGVGLIGGSIGKALISRKLATEVVGIFRREETLKKALLKKAVTSGVLNDYANALAGADLVCITTPVDEMKEVFKKIASNVTKGTIVTDGGSTKKIIAGWARKYKNSFSFVGGHPLAGSEKTGVDAASDKLFEGSICILTRSADTDREHLSLVGGMWNSLGAKVEIMTPDKHDEILASISHLPHVVAYALAGTPSKAELKFAASGFRDTTRIAASDAGLWAGIIMSNKRNVMGSIKRFNKVLLSLEKDIVRGDVSALKSKLQRIEEVRHALFSKD